MKSRSLILVIGILSSFLLIVTPVAYSQAASSATETLKVGVPNAYTGSGASSGIPTLKAYKIQAEILKENGGFTVGGKKYNIDLVQADDG